MITVVSLCLLLCAGTACTSEEAKYQRLTDKQKRSAEYALLGLETRQGLETRLYAAEDMLVNPTNMDIDAEGRVWVTEGYNYRPRLNPDNPVREAGDRIVILEDTDGDSRADTSKVFYQGPEINAALGIMVLDSRVFVSVSPHVFVFTDADGDDRADHKQVLFSGIEGVQHDHAVHAFVFGPDGKLYFNFGNEGQVIKDAGGDVVKDIFGREVRADGDPYRQGMVFRCNPDGSAFEVLAHNFRNNYEVAVDSYGTLWQSDNDDDGNRGVRINYVMEYGNYGYTDQMTGAGWRTRRTGMAGEIPLRHWHQNDPGVVPNLLQTGAGSPTGIVVYEGSLLPEVFHNEMIHADAGPNVVRSYPVEPDGAGYTARIEPILKGEKDRWFRPSDVTVAPDGSIFVADWYDPGVGGHQMGDQQRGRIFRIAPEGTPYRVPAVELSSPEGAVQALKNPNLNVRANAWMRLNRWGADAEPALAELWKTDHPRYRARALWLLSKIEGVGKEYIEQALADANPDIRITGLRAARQLAQPVELIPYLEQLAGDPSPQVRREVAIALHQNRSQKAAEIWVDLALRHDGKDRWYLEALGIGAAGQWDRFFPAWQDEVGSDWDTPAGRDIVWRARAGAALPLLVDLIEDPSVALEQKLRYFRAFDFHLSPGKQQQIITLLESDFSEEDRIPLLALKHLDKTALGLSSQVEAALERALELTRGSYEFVELVDKFELENRNEELVTLMLAFPDSSLGIDAAGLALQQGGLRPIRKVLNGEDRPEKSTMLRVLGKAGRPQAIELLQTVALDENRPLELRKEAVTALGSGWNGEQRIAELLESGLIPPSLQKTAGRTLTDSWRGDIRETGRKYVEGEEGSQGGALPPIPELASMEGDVENGRQVFEQSCRICHQVNGQGIEFGPDLSQIGAKLARQGLYEAILTPDAGINFGYEGYILTFNDGSRAAGIIQSETEDELVLRMPGGYTTGYDKSGIRSREQMEQSLMPSGLEANMTRQELVDLVEYLSTLTDESAGSK